MNTALVSPIVQPLAPWSEDAEQAVLGAMLTDVDALASGITAADATMFFLERHRHLFAAMAALHAADSVVDPLTLANELEKQGTLHAAGGKDYIGTLLDVVPTAANVEYHLRIVKEKAERRRILKTLEDAAALARFGQMAPEALAKAVRAALETVERSHDAGLQLYDDTELANLPMPPQLIEGVLPSNALAVLFGEKGSLKTFLALGWSADIALGLDQWHNRRVRRGAVVYGYGEGRVGIGPRTEALQRHYGVDSLGILFLPQRIAINEPSACTAFLAAIERKLGSREVALIVLDTLNRFASGNENSTEDMSAFVRGCDTLREATGATVLVVHHKGHGVDDRGRGSSVLDAAADTVIYCARDDDRLTIECKKMKDGPEFGKLALEVLPVVPSLVLRAVGLATGPLKGQRLQCLRALVEQSTDNGWTGKAWWDATGIKGKSSFYAPREWLSANSYISSQGGRWKATDAGRLALGSFGSSRSSASPVVQNGPQPKVVHPQGGVYNTPALDQGQRRESA